MRAVRARIARCALALGLLAGLSGCAESTRESVTILVPWSGLEFQAFYSIIEKYMAENPNVDVIVQATRALDRHLDAAVIDENRSPDPGMGDEDRPDLVVLPSPGSIQERVEVEQLHALGGFRKAELMERFGVLRSGDKVVAVPIKVDVKSLIWYVADTDTRPSWRSVARANSEPPGKRWCLGLESGATSGWPGADWIADILLSGPQGRATYEQWTRGDKAWGSSEIKKAWRDWGGVVNRSANDAPVRNFAAVEKELASASGDCDLVHGALGALNPSERLRENKKFTFEQPPPGVPLQVSADYVAKFSKNNQAADDLINFLVEKENQRDWMNYPGSTALSPVRNVLPPPSSSTARRDIAKLLQEEKNTFCFSAADMMPPELSAAFYRAVVDYYVNRNDEKESEGVLKESMEVLDEISYREREKSEESRQEDVLPLVCSDPRRITQ